MRSPTKLVKDVAWKWQSSGHPKGALPKTVPRQANFVLEPLEPRVLLSATVAEVPAAIDPVPDNGSVVFQDSVEGQASTAIAYQDHSASIIPDQKELSPATQDAGAEPGVTTATQAKSDPATGATTGGVVPQDGTIEAGAGVPEGGSLTEQLTETLNAANGPPLAHMRLVNDDLSLLSGQLFYLNFAGASSIAYNGPVQVDVDLPTFQLPPELSGQKSSLIRSVIDSLNDRFASVHVGFTDVNPDAGSDYSTIYIGGNGSAFSRYGSF